MRKFRLMPFVLVASVFGLSACTLPSWLSFLSFIPGLEAPEKEEKKEEKKEEEEEKKEEKSYTAEEVAEAFNEGIATVAPSLSAQYYDIADVFTGWYLGVNFGASEGDSESNLQACARTLAQFVPEYMVLDQNESGYSAATEEDDALYCYYFESPDAAVGVEVYGFVDVDEDDGETLLDCAEIYIYDIE